MRKTIFWLVLLAAYQSLLAQTRLDSLRMYYQHSILAYSDGNYPRYLEMTEKALRLNPNNYALQYNYAAALALNGKKLEARSRRL